MVESESKVESPTASRKQSELVLDEDTLVVFSCKLSEQFTRILASQAPKSRLSWAFLAGSSAATLNSQNGLRIVTRSRVNDSDWHKVHATEWSEYQNNAEYVEFFIPLRMSSTEVTNFKFELYMLHSGLVALVECNSRQLFQSIITNNLFIINLFNPDSQLLVAELHLSLLKASSPTQSGSLIVSSSNPIFKQESLLEQLYIVPSLDHSFVLLYEAFCISDELTTNVPSELARLFADYESQNLRTIVEMNFEDFGNAESLNSIQQRLVASHRELIKYYQSIVDTKKSLMAPAIFRKSVQKKDKALQWFPVNCGVQKLVARNCTSNHGVFPQYDELDVVTFGATAGHGFGFNAGSSSNKSGSKTSSNDHISNAVDYQYLDGVHHELTKTQVEINCLFQDFFSLLEEILDLPHHSDTLTSKLADFQVFCTSILQQTHSSLHMAWSMTSKLALNTIDDVSVHELDERMQRIRERVTSTLLPKFSSQCSRFVSIKSARKSQIDQSLINKGVIENYHVDGETIGDLTEELISCSHGLQESLIRLLDASKANVNQTYLTHGFSSPAYDSAAMEERKRGDACFSQALTVLCTGFSAFLDRAFRHIRKSCFNEINNTIDHETWFVRNWIFWECLYEVGYLAGIESLLSVYGDEKFMLQDMRNAFSQINESVRIGIHDISSDGEVVKIGGSRQALVLSLGVATAIYQDLPADLGERSIRPHCVMFSRGINEQQIIARWTGDMDLENSINQSSFRTLKIIISNWKKWVKERSNNGTGGMFIFPTDFINNIDQLLESLEYVISNSAKQTSSSSLDQNLLNGVKCRWNDTTILLLSSKIIRMLSTCNTHSISQPDPLPIIGSRFSSASGFSAHRQTSFYPTPPFASRFTACKSGKDRTSMSVTLEQTLFVSFDNDCYKSRSRSTAFASMEDLQSVRSSRSASSWTMSDQAIGMSKPDIPTFCIHSSAFYKILHAMRGEEGVRLSLVELNLSMGPFASLSRPGSSNRVDTEDDDCIAEQPKMSGSGGERGEFGKFAFHPLQVGMLPHLYRPPLRCVQAGIST